ncbi:MAG: hypothetical protein IPF53_23015 [Blastocatellia bacterium]|nr:hypothetical protein [Blastocatellia bacterium]
MHKLTTALVLAGAVAASLACNRGATTPAPTTPATPASPAAPATPDASTAPAAPTTPAAGAAGIAGEPIPDFPDYPGATRVGYEVGGPKAAEYKSKVEAKFTTPDPVANVKAHYQQAVTSGGWTIVKQKDTPTEVEWTVSKAGSTVEIDIEVNPMGVTKVSVERKNIQ